MSSLVGNHNHRLRWGTIFMVWVYQLSYTENEQRPKYHEKKISFCDLHTV